MKENQSAINNIVTKVRKRGKRRGGRIYIKNKKHSENADTSTSVTFDLDV